MDALSLLCTLHADGPATRKRLQNAGYESLSALLERPLSELAAALDVAPAAARRLLREARLLAERVGPDLEAEDAPAPVPASPGPEPFSLELPPVVANATLDQGDRALLERIVREGRALRAADPEPELALAEGVLAAVAARAAAAPPPALAPPPTALERAGIDLSEERPWPAAAPEVEAASAAFVKVEQVVRDTASGPGTHVEWTTDAVIESIATPDALLEVALLPIELLAPARTPSEPERAVDTRAELRSVEVPRRASVPDPVPLLALDGVDAELASALARAGVHTALQLAEANALHLARELHLTVAQAKRLCFLARRATLVHPAPPAPTHCQQRAAWRIEPQSQPLVPAPEHPAPTPVVRVAAPEVRPVPAPLAARANATPTAMHPVAATPMPSGLPSGLPTGPPSGPRPRFWEPRSGASADAPSGASEPQGVPVDPSEVDRPRRFTDARRAAAQLQAAVHAEPAPPPAAPEGRNDRDSGGSPPRVGTILGWDFEIPRPALQPEPEPERERRTWRPLEVDESSAGPFA